MLLSKQSPVVRGADAAVSIARLKGTVVETGQAVEINAPRRRKRRKGWRDRVGLVDLTLMAKLELSGLEYRVLMAVMACVPEKGGADAFCTMQEIADTLNVSPSSAARVFKGLQSRHVLTLRRQGRWHVNSWLMYNGDFDSWGAEAEQDPEPIWVRGVDTETGEMK